MLLLHNFDSTVTDNAGDTSTNTIKSQIWISTLTHKGHEACMSQAILVSVATAHATLSRLWLPAIQVPITAGWIGGTGKVIPYSLPIVGPRADPGVQAVSLQMIFWIITSGRLPLLSPGLRSPSQLKNITVLRPVPSYTAWWQRNIGVNSLPKVVTQLCPTPYHNATAPPVVD